MMRVFAGIWNSQSTLNVIAMVSSLPLLLFVLGGPFLPAMFALDGERGQRVMLMIGADWVIFGTAFVRAWLVECSSAKMKRN